MARGRLAGTGLPSHFPCQLVEVILTKVKSTQAASGQCGAQTKLREEIMPSQSRSLKRYEKILFYQRIWQSNARVMPRGLVLEIPYRQALLFAAVQRGWPMHYFGYPKLQY